MGFNLPTIKTQDIDFLVKAPYKGQEVDIESVLKPLGFSIGFNPDGSTYFTNGVFKVEFLPPERGKGIDKAVSIKPLRIKATPLRYLEMFFDQQVKIQKEDYTFLIPSPWVFAYHKILMSKKRKSMDKKEKDILQVNSILREISKRPKMVKKRCVVSGNFTWPLGHSSIHTTLRYLHLVPQRITELKSPLDYLDEE